MFWKTVQGNMFVTSGVEIRSYCLMSHAFSRKSLAHCEKPKATERLRIVKPRIQQGINSNLGVELTTQLVLWYLCSFPRMCLATNEGSTTTSCKVPSPIHERRLLALSCPPVRVSACIILPPTVGMWVKIDIEGFYEGLLRKSRFGQSRTKMGGK